MKKLSVLPVHKPRFRLLGRQKSLCEPWFIRSKPGLKRTAKATNMQSQSGRAGCADSHSLSGIHGELQATQVSRLKVLIVELDVFLSAWQTCKPEVSTSSISSRDQVIPWSRMFSACPCSDRPSSSSMKLKSSLADRRPTTGLVESRSCGRGLDNGDRLSG